MNKYRKIWTEDRRLQGAQRLLDTPRAEAGRYKRTVFVIVKVGEGGFVDSYVLMENSVTAFFVSLSMANVARHIRGARSTR